MRRGRVLVGQKLDPHDMVLPVPTHEEQNISTAFNLPQEQWWRLFSRPVSPMHTISANNLSSKNTRCSHCPDHH
jgi:hypothetical protein